MDITRPILSGVRIAGHWCGVHYKGQRRLCFSCGREGHLSRKCPSKAQNAPIEANPGSSSTEGPQLPGSVTPSPDVVAADSMEQGHSSGTQEVPTDNGIAEIVDGLVSKVVALVDQPIPNTALAARSIDSQSSDCKTAAQPILTLSVRRNGRSLSRKTKPTPPTCSKSRSKSRSPLRKNEQLSVISSSKSDAESDDSSHASFETVSKFSLDADDFTSADDNLASPLIDDVLDSPFSPVSTNFPFVPVVARAADESSILLRFSVRASSLSGEGESSS